MSLFYCDMSDYVYTMSYYWASFRTLPLLCYMYHVFLQYEEGELYDNFREFYNDVWPEFSKAGRIVQFKVWLRIQWLQYTFKIL